MIEAMPSRVVALFKLPQVSVFFRALVWERKVFARVSERHFEPQLTTGLESPSSLAVTKVRDWTFRVRMVMRGSEARGRLEPQPLHFLST
jgi:hypothetical protein